MSEKQIFPALVTYQDRVAVVASADDIDLSAKSFTVTNSGIHLDGFLFMIEQIGCQKEYDLCSKEYDRLMSIVAPSTVQHRKMEYILALLVSWEGRQRVGRNSVIPITSYRRGSPPEAA